MSREIAGDHIEITQKYDLLQEDFGEFIDLIFSLRDKSANLVHGRKTDFANSFYEGINKYLNFEAEHYNPDFKKNLKGAVETESKRHKEFGVSLKNRWWYYYDFPRISRNIMNKSQLAVPLQTNGIALSLRQRKDVQLSGVTNAGFYANMLLMLKHTEPNHEIQNNRGTHAIEFFVDKSTAGSKDFFPKFFLDFFTIDNFTFAAAKLKMRDEYLGHKVLIHRKEAQNATQTYHAIVKALKHNHRGFEHNPLSGHKFIPEHNIVKDLRLCIDFDLISLRFDFSPPDEKKDVSLELTIDRPVVITSDEIFFPQQKDGIREHKLNIFETEIRLEIKNRERALAEFPQAKKVYELLVKALDEKSDWLAASRYTSKYQKYVDILENTGVNTGR